MTEKVWINGLLIEAVDLICDPPPHDQTMGAVRLRVRLNSAIRKRVDDVVPIVFSFRGEIYHGVFRRIVAYENGGCEYMFITDSVMPIGSLLDC